MSFSVSVQGTKDELVNNAREKFDSTNPEPAPGTKELFEAAVATLESFAAVSQDDGYYSVGIGGHAKQNDDERDYLSFSLNATQAPSVVEAPVVDTTEEAALVQDTTPNDGTTAEAPATTE